MWIRFWSRIHFNFELICRALYGGKYIGSTFWKHLRSFMTHLGFTLCKSDTGIWKIPAQRDNEITYLEYDLIYVDEEICINQRQKYVLWSDFDKYFCLKEGSVRPPIIYLGNKFSNMNRKRNICMIS